MMMAVCLRCAWLDNKAVVSAIYMCGVRPAWIYMVNAPNYSLAHAPTRGMLLWLQGRQMRLSIDCFRKEAAMMP